MTSPWSGISDGRHLVGVFACLFNSRRELLLLHRSDHDMWCLPGGLVEVGESVTDAIVRECREEIGVEIAVDGVLGVYSDPAHHLFRLSSGGVLHYVTVVFAARQVAGTPSSFSVESRAAGYFPREGLPALVPSHTVWIHDAFVPRDEPYVR